MPVIAFTVSRHRLITSNRLRTTTNSRAKWKKESHASTRKNYLLLINIHPSLHSTFCFDSHSVSCSRNNSSIFILLSLYDRQLPKVNYFKTRNQVNENEEVAVLFYPILPKAELVWSGRVERTTLMPLFFTF